MSQKVNYENLFAARRQGDGRHRIKKVRVRKTDKSYFDDENGTRWSRLDLDKQPQDGRVGAYQSAKGDKIGWFGYSLYTPDSTALAQLRKDIESFMGELEFKRTVCAKLRNIADNPLTYGDDYLPKLKMINDLLESDAFKNAK